MQQQIKLREIRPIEKSYTSKSFLYYFPSIRLIESNFFLIFEEKGAQIEIVTF